MRNLEILLFYALYQQHQSDSLATLRINFMLVHRKQFRIAVLFLLHPQDQKYRKTNTFFFFNINKTKTASWEKMHTIVYVKSFPTYIHSDYFTHD